MNSAAQRKELVNELRKAHFPFGFENNSTSKSEYVHKYDEKVAGHRPAELMKPTGSNVPLKDLDERQGQTMSEFKERYPQWKTEGQARGGGSTANNTPHIVLGYDGDKTATNYTDDFPTRPLEANQRVIKIGRPSNIHLGDTLTDFTTQYHQHHGVKEGNSSASQSLNNSSRDARQSNLVLGYEANGYATQNQADFQNKRASMGPAQNSKAHSTTSVVLQHPSVGDDRFESENRANFTKKASQAQQVGKQVIMDFRSAHFSFGNEKDTEFQSEARSNYTQKQQSEFLSAKKGPSGNLSVQQGFSQPLTSSYSTAYNREVGSYQRAVSFPRHTGQGVLMGTDPNDFVTEHHASFNKPIEAVKTVTAIKHASTLSLGDGPKGAQYRTHNMDIYQNRFNEYSSSKLTQDQIQAKRDINIVVGFAGAPPYALSSQSYGSQIGESNRLSAAQLAAMKGTNIKAGDSNRLEGMTTYDVEFNKRSTNQV